MIIKRVSNALVFAFARDGSIDLHPKYNIYFSWATGHRCGFTQPYGDKMVKRLLDNGHAKTFTFDGRPL